LHLLIFDIDGTLTHLNGATRRAFDAAYVRLFGMHAKTDQLKLHGRTDKIIFHELHELSGLSGQPEDAYHSFREIYLEELPRSIAATPKAQVLPGVMELLLDLDRRKNRVALALGTGNMEAGARTKIGFFDLNKFFPVGGFGDHHHYRYQIMQDAIRNAEAWYRTHFAPGKTWVIGDTPHDVEGGKHLNLMTMGVATGGAFSAQDLMDSGADVVFENFLDTAQVVKAFNLD
jgi:phosphoglycolate phosphatase-like HAD superfamily hydrolase